jgi:hypothetical protein
MSLFCLATSAALCRVDLAIAFLVGAEVDHAYGAHRQGFRVKPMIGTSEVSEVVPDLVELEVAVPRLSPAMR